MSEGQHSSQHSALMHAEQMHAQMHSALPDPQPKGSEADWQAPKGFPEHDGPEDLLEDECVNWGEEVLILP